MTLKKRKMSTFERLNNGPITRKQRRELARRVAAADPGLSIVNPHAAGIEVGNDSHFAAVPRGETPSQCRSSVSGRPTCIKWRNGWWHAASTQ